MKVLLLSRFRSLLLLMLVVFMLIPLCGRAQEKATTRDSVDRDAPDFVKVSLLMASPADVLYSCLGHACLRMQCPTFGLDNCYSYEGERVQDKVLTFFAGRLRMGMFSVKTDEFLAEYSKDNRGVVEYELNLPIATKRRMWQLLDQRVAEGAELPYDYLERGCAQSTLQVILEAASGEDVDFGEWPDKYNRTTREIVSNNLDNYPWTDFLLHAIVGTACDKDVTCQEKVLIPTDLVEVLQQLKIDDQAVITSQPVERVKDTQNIQPSILRPIHVGIAFLVLAVIGLFACGRVIDGLLLAIQFVVSIVIAYLYGFSKLPNTEWTWLVVPFNLLPFVLWRWRRLWSLGYASVLVLWALVMCLYPHQLTNLTYVVFALALAITYAKQDTYLLGKRLRFGKRAS